MRRSGGGMKCSRPKERVLWEGFQLERSANSSRNGERNRPRDAGPSPEGPEGGLG